MLDIIIYSSLFLIIALVISGIGWLVFDLLFGKEGTKGLAEVPYTSPLGTIRTAKKSRTDHIV